MNLRLVNDALDEIGMTPYHWKLFCLNGFGYAVDSLILLIQVCYAFLANSRRQAPGARARCGKRVWK